MSRKLTIEQFILKAKAIHGDEYDYSLVKYEKSSLKIRLICRIHGEFSQVANSHLLGYKCKKCSIITTKKTNLERYGVENPAHSIEIQQKIKKTNLERYGNISPFGDKEIQKKSKKTNLERYGVEYALSSSEIQKKSKKTMVDRYGVEYAAQSKEIMEKLKSTNIEKYGVEYTFQSENNRNKTKQTNIEKYGVEHVQQNKMIRNKTKQTNIEKYGVEYPWQKNNNNLFDREWLFEQYIMHNKTANQIAKEMGINKTTVLNYLHKHEIEIRYMVGYSMKCIQWLELIMNQEGIFIQHAMNGGEYLIPGTRFKVDGYCKENNTVYEFHGDIFHGNPDLFNDDDRPNFYQLGLTAKELYNKTKDREQEIINLGYGLVVMWENNYSVIEEKI